MISILVKFLGREISRTSSLSSSDDVIKDTEEYVKFKQRKDLLYAIIGLLMLLIVLTLIFTIIFTFVRKNNSTSKNDNIVEYRSPLGKS